MAAQTAAAKLISDNRKVLDALVAALDNQDYLTAEDMQAIVTSCTACVKDIVHD